MAAYWGSTRLSGINPKRAFARKMKKTDWKDVAELVGIAAIVASLVFVGLQLRQEQVIARTELASVSAEIKNQINYKISDPGFSKTFAKMLTAPGDLSLEEKVQLHGVYWMVIEAFKRDCYIMNRGIFEECEEQIQSLAPLYFGNEYSQDWWRANRQETAYSLPDWVDSLILNLDKNTSLRLLRKENTKQ